MSHNADRMRDLLSEAAREPGSAWIGADFDRALQAIEHLSSANHRAWEANVEAHAELWQDIANLRDDLHAVVRRVESVAQAMATRADIDDVRLEMIDRTSPSEAA